MSDTDTLTADAPAEDAAAPAAPAAGRKAPTNLEADIRSVLDALVTGTLSLDGKQATPHVIANQVQILRGGDPADKPSSGAVSAALIRWGEVGYIELQEKPLAFLNYTEAATTEGLAALKKAHREAGSAARKAAKAASAPVAADPTPAPEPEPEIEFAVPVDSGDDTPF